MDARRCGAMLPALLISAVVAHSAAACVTAAEVVVRMDADMPNASIETVEGSAAKRITAGISALTGAEVAPGGAYILADLPDTALTYVVRVAGGCATHHGRFSRRLVRGWVNGQLAEA